MILYLRHCFKAFYLHGIHSPFVFDFVKYGLKSKPKKSKDTTLNALIQTITYFGCQRVKCSSTHIEKELRSHYPYMIFKAPFYDLIIEEDITAEKISFYLSEGIIRPNSLLFIPLLKTQRLLWRRLMSMPQVTVSLDGYYYGIIFFKKNQAKEHFWVVC